MKISSIEESHVQAVSENNKWPKIKISLPHLSNPFFMTNSLETFYEAFDQMVYTAWRNIM